MNSGADDSQGLKQGISMATTLMLRSALRSVKTVQIQRQLEAFSTKVTSKENTRNEDSFGDTFGRGRLPDKLIEPSRLRKQQMAKEAENRKRANLKELRNSDESEKFGGNTNSEPGKRMHSLQNVPSRMSAAKEPEDDTDSFGSLDGNPLPTEADDLDTDDEDRREEKYLNTRPIHWKTSRDYCDKIRQLIEERKLSDALSLFDKMLHEDRVKPDYYVYNVLIGGCGRAGYSKMAFKLYNEMKERQMYPDESTFTGLFNACANSPWTHDGILRARKLYQNICDKGIIMNSKNYHAAIKAFGRCYDLQMAFRLVDEMVRNSVVVSTETFSFLISGCVSDSDSGFLRAIQVWRKMREKRIRPNVYSYNLLLRSIRKCGIGNVKFASELLLAEGKSEAVVPQRETTIDGNQDGRDNTSSSLTTKPEVSNLPDLLSPNVKPSAVVAFGEVKTAQDRLQLLGGAAGVLYRMDRDGVKPDLKTFTELMQSAPESLEAENELLETMDSRRVRPDVDFFNVLIKKRACRGDFRDAKNVLLLVAKHGLHADIATFGTLALTCENWESAKCLLSDMDEAGFQANIYVMGTLVRKACCTRDFWYLIDMLKRMKLYNIVPNPKMISDLEDCKLKTKRFIIDKEKQGIRFDESNELVKGFIVFLKYYAKWSKEMEIDLPDHPWSSFRTEKADETGTASETRA